MKKRNNIPVLYGAILLSMLAASPGLTSDNGACVLTFPAGAVPISEPQSRCYYVSRSQCINIQQALIKTFNGKYVWMNWYQSSSCQEVCYR